MFRIAICDDEKQFINYLKELISDYMTQNGYTCRFDTFGSGEEFVSQGINILNYTIVFLDINMDRMNGVETAKKIREINKELFIVFVTAYVDYALEGYKLDVTRYLLKDNHMKNAINECLDTIIEKINYVVVKKTFNFYEAEKKIVLERLLYIESRLHKLIFFVMEEELKTYTMYATLNDIEIELKDYGFIRIHQSFLVNLKYIRNVLRYKAVLSNGTELSIPKARYRQVKDAFIAYQGEV